MHRENSSGKWYTGEVYAPSEQQRKMVYRRGLRTKRTAAENGTWYKGDLYALKEQQGKQ